MTVWSILVMLLYAVPEYPFGKLALLHIQGFEQFPQANLPRFVFIDLHRERTRFENIQTRRGAPNLMRAFGPKVSQRSASLRHEVWSYSTFKIILTCLSRAGTPTAKRIDRTVHSKLAEKRLSARQIRPFRC